MGITAILGLFAFKGSTEVCNVLGVLFSELTFDLQNLFSALIRCDNLRVIYKFGYNYWNLGGKLLGLL